MKKILWYLFWTMAGMLVGVAGALIEQLLVVIVGALMGGIALAFLRREIINYPVGGNHEKSTS